MRMSTLEEKKMEGVAKCRSNEPSLTESGQESSNVSSNVSGQTGVPESQGKSAKCDPRRSRLKVFNKVMEKSLQRLIEDAR